jgi:hypothetical protein
MDQLLEDCFTKYLQPPTARDVYMEGVVSKDHLINHAQYLDLLYSQSGTLYDLILHAPRLSNDLSKLAPRTHVDGMVGSIKLHSTTQSIGNKAIQPPHQPHPRLVPIPNMLPLLQKIPR